MKINNSEEHIKLAAQHFLSKNLEEIQETADKTMEGHQRIVFMLIEIKKRRIRGSNPGPLHYE